MCSCIYIFIYTYKDVYIYIHIYTYTFIRIYMCIYTNRYGFESIDALSPGSDFRFDNPKNKSILQVHIKNNVLSNLSIEILFLM